MKVFISWSKPRSEALARALFDWLPVVLQACKPWMSPAIEAGTRSLPTIDASLAESAYGILIVTPENQHERWLNYEAGWLASAIGPPGSEDRPVVPLLFDMAISDLQYPMAQFQAVEYSEATIHDLLVAMNGRLDEPLDLSVVDNAFSAQWSHLVEKIAHALAIPHEATTARASESQTAMLSELVEKSRDMDRDLAYIRQRLDQVAPADVSAAGEEAAMIAAMPVPVKVRARLRQLLGDGTHLQGVRQDGELTIIAACQVSTSEQAKADALEFSSTFGFRLVLVDPESPASRKARGVRRPVAT